MSYKLEPEDIGVNTAKELSLTEIVERAIKVNQGRRNVLKAVPAWRRCQFLV